MASISTDSRGNRRILFVGRDRKRRCVRLGKLPMNAAETICSKVVTLNGAATAGHGLDHETALRVAHDLASNKQVLLKTMVEKELGLIVDDDDANALRGALVMGGSFGVAAVVPIVPYLFLPVSHALYLSVGASALTLFGMGAIKSRWTRRHWLPSGLEIFLLR